MAPILYTREVSPPVRAVLMTAKAIGLEFQEKTINLFRREHLTPDFRQLNPQHTVPTLVDDDGFVLWDSHAIMAYLVSKYAKNDRLYPQDLKKRSIVNQRLYFDSGVMFPCMSQISRLVLFDCSKTIDEKIKAGVFEAYGFLEKFLKGNEWVSGDFVSIADYSLVATVSTLDRVIPVDYDEFPNVVEWLFRCEDLPGYEENRNGLKEVTKMFKMRLLK